eukprot:scaffold548_cov190-Ochromonas_danica.AAC.4
MTGSKAENVTKSNNFSSHKRVLAEHRCSMSPHTFEALMLLSQNANLWNIDTVKKAISGKKNDEEATVVELEDDTGDEYDPKILLKITMMNIIAFRPELVN